MSVLEAFIHDPLVEWEEQKRREVSRMKPLLLPYSNHFQLGTIPITGQSDHCRAFRPAHLCGQEHATDRSEAPWLFGSR
jgi:hypothetical protein